MLIPLKDLSLKHSLQPANEHQQKQKANTVVTREIRLPTANERLKKFCSTCKDRRPHATWNLHQNPCGTPHS